MNRLIVIALLILLVFAAGCVPGDGSRSPAHPAGFFAGIWHGWVAPISLIWGFFNRSIRIYESNNAGWRYDFGFYMAVISGFGGLSLSRKKRKEHDRNDEC